MGFEEILSVAVAALVTVGVGTLWKTLRSISGIHSRMTNNESDIKELKEVDKKHEDTYVTKRECDIRNAGR